MLEVADIFRIYGKEYLDKFTAKMPPTHRSAMRDMINCRTASMGGSWYECDGCGRRVYSYHSCKNRSCPKCHGKDTARWLKKRREELLPVGYFHLVFSLPEELRPHVRSNQQAMYTIIMRAAAKSIIKLAADPHYVGGLVGVMAILHTWTRTMVYHPHVHCLVPAGGITPEGQWKPSRNNYLVPVKALSTIFRGMVRDFVAKELPELDIPPAVWKKPWVVFSKPPIDNPNPQMVLKYLSRYVHRIAIVNSRILSIDGGKVTFKYQDNKTGQWNTMTLAAEEFIRRFLQHVLPRGIHKVRYYGLWNPAHREKLKQVQLQLAKDKTQPAPQTGSTLSIITDVVSMPLDQKVCPHCKKGVLKYKGVLLRQKTSMTQQTRPP